MAIDYRERRVVAKNRPSKQPISTVVVAFALVIIAAYGLGVATGWLFFRVTPRPQAVAKPANVQLPGTVSVPQNPTVNPGGQVATPVTPSNAPAPPLTFYDTLPKGEKAVMGSGLNPKAAVPPVKPQPDTAPAVKAVPAAPASPAGKPATPANLPKPVVPASAPAKVPTMAPAKKGGFTVQVASTKDKAGAESIRARLAAHGKAAYIVEGQIADKGTWFRVRVGHKLDEAKARELAVTLGGGAVVVPD